MRVHDSWEYTVCAQCGKEAENVPRLIFLLPHISTPLVWAQQQSKHAGSRWLCANGLPRPATALHIWGQSLKTQLDCIPSRGLIPYLFPFCPLAWLCMLISYILFLPNKNPFLGPDAYVPDCWPLQGSLNTPSCKHTFN